MADSISAASLLMAVVAILYGAWYQEIIRVAELAIPRHDKGVLRQEVAKVYKYKCLSLLALSLAVSLVFIPDVLSILINSVCYFNQYGMVESLKAYSSTYTAFCLVVVVLLGFCIHVFFLTIRVRKPLRICRKFWRFSCYQCLGRAVDDG